MRSLAIVVTFTACLGCPGAAPSAPAPAHNGGAERPPGQGLSALAAPRATTVVSTGMGKTYDDELAALRRRYRAQLARTKTVRGRAPWQAAAGTALQIGRMTGDYKDYKTAEEAVAKTFDAGSPHGSYLLRAKFNYQLHRLDAAETDLTGARAAARAGGNKARAAVEVFVGNLAMQRGKYDEAQTQWDAAEALDKDSAHYARALWAFKTADFETAERLYSFSSRNYHGRGAEGAAWLDLLLAIMDLERGRYDNALAHLDDADADLSGYWLVDEHRAEITALKGDLKSAEVMYRDIVGRTNSPEFMDALASILRKTGRDDEAQLWINRATVRFEDQMALFPEAAYGHALGHFLDFGPPQRALDLARKNFRVRPNTEARMLLARAELDMGNLTAATTLIKVALKAPWNNATLHEIAYKIFTAAGDGTAAQQQLAAARAIDPTVKAITIP